RGLQRLQGGGAPARQGGGARAGRGRRPREHGERRRRLRRPATPLRALAGGRAGARAFAGPRSGDARGLLPPAEPAENTRDGRARGQRGRLLRLEPDADDRRDAARRRRGAGGLSAMSERPLDAGRLHVFIDFDGTITRVDTLQFLTERLGGGAALYRETG